jgi:hypothetical protein
MTKNIAVGLDNQEVELFGKPNGSHPKGAKPPRGLVRRVRSRVTDEQHEQLVALLANFIRERACRRLEMLHPGRISDKLVDPLIDAAIGHLNLKETGAVGEAAKPVE